MNNGGLLEGLRARTTNGSRSHNTKTAEELALKWTCRKRDGSIVPFNTSKIKTALRKCFLNVEASDQAVSATPSDYGVDVNVEKITLAVVRSLAAQKTTDPDVEDVQRLVIQQLWAEGLFTYAEHYQNHRELRRQARLQKPIAQSVIDRVLEDQKHFPSPIQYYQFVSKFARWREEDKRRETWSEACDRTLTWFKTLPRVKLHDNEWQMLRDSIYSVETCCALRVLQMAGPALERCHVGAFNCAYCPIDSWRSFSEILYVLMAGSGCGFSVEDRYISQLPRIEHQKTPAVVYEHTVADSTEGWCYALLFGLERWCRGEDVKYDVSLIRKKGSRLKTKGGRSSGPDPLVAMLTFARKLFLSRQGKILTDIDCHDLACMIGKIVQVGGVRRAAMISISDVDSQAMRDCKSGNWYERAIWRTMANNSAAYSERPDIDTFLAEFSALVKSRSGERGILNRKAIDLAMPLRRKRGYIMGVNPCVSADTWVHTATGPKQVNELIGKQFSPIVDGCVYESSGFVKTGRKALKKVRLKNGMEFRATDNHQVLVVSHQSQKVQRTEWLPVSELSAGTRVVLHNHRGAQWDGSGTFEEGWLLGNLLGDGNITKDGIANLDHWGPDRLHLMALSVERIHATVGGRSDLQGCAVDEGKTRTQSTNLGRLAKKYGMINDNKHINPLLEDTSSEFHAGFLRGYFDADGSVCGTQDKGVSVRLSSVCLDDLTACQRMLARLGIIATVYRNRKLAGDRLLPDGNGGQKLYPCQTSHELIIANDNVRVFREVVDFDKPTKHNRLQTLLTAYKRALNRERFCSEIVSITDDGVEDVYDCTVPGPQAFDANGCYVHNCGEIFLRAFQFCNLSIVIARPWDTEETLINKVRIATYWGCMQKTATRFQYLRDDWQRNCEEEALLGVDITGHADCPLLRFGAPGRAALLRKLKDVVEQTDIELSQRFGVNRSAANTCVKPSGDSSVLFNCGSGCSPWFDNYIMRWVREPVTSPVAKFLQESGVPHAVAPEDPALLVFGFPRKAPTGATTRHQMTAIDQLNNWVEWKENWAEHSVSCTIYVDEHEWPDVMAWCYNNFDRITGLSFLPRDNGRYTYAPNEAMTAETYEKAMSTFPTINWAKLQQYEHEDTTESSMTPACTGGSCEI